MVHHSKKHRVAETAEQYGDYVLLLVGGVSLAALIGAISMITFLPDHGTAGLFSLADTAFSIGGYAFTWGAVIAAGSGLVAYGTNQATDALKNVQDAWKETEAVAAGFTVLFPVAHDSFASVSNLTAGEPMMQVIALGAYVYAMSYVVDL